MLGLHMPEIGAELDHLAVGVDPLSVPARNRANGESMPQVMDARATPMPTEALRRAQTDLLRDDGEVVAGRAIAQSATVVVAEERTCRRPEKPHALGAIGAEPFDRARCDRHEARTTVLAALHRDHPGVEIDVIVVELQRLV